MGLQLLIVAISCRMILTFSADILQNNSKAFVVGLAGGTESPLLAEAERAVLVCTGHSGQQRAVELKFEARLSFPFLKVS